MKQQRQKKCKLSFKFILRILVGFAISLGLIIIVTNYYIVTSQEVQHDALFGDHGNRKHHNQIIQSTTTNTAKQRETITIPYMISITSCDNPRSIIDGAAVLQHSIHLVHKNKNATLSASISSSLSTTTRSQDTTSTYYDYKMYAIHLPTAKSCAMPLQEKLGFILIEREVPVSVEEIQGDFLRERIQQNGCCGEKELIKLEAYTMSEQAPIVVHLDIDAILLKPLDPLFDLMLLDNTTATASRDDVNVMWKEKPLPSQINAMFTLDYGMVAPRRQYKPVQGGFLILRPDLNVYNELVDTVRKGDFRERHGWGGKVGPFFGSMTIQGLLSYYYYLLHPNTSLELNRCVYNQMSENPRTGGDDNTTAASAVGKCWDGREICEDCRQTNLSNIVSIHFTLCQKPWLCMAMQRNTIQSKQCRKFHHEWFRIRSSLEESLGNNSTGTGKWFKEQFYGFCNRYGQRGYLQLQFPD